MTIKNESVSVRKRVARRARTVRCDPEATIKLAVSAADLQALMLRLLFLASI